MSRQKYNILFLGFVPYIGGAEISTLLLLKYIDRERFNPIYIIPDNGPLFERLTNMGVNVITMPLKKIKLPFPIGYVKTVWRLTQFIRKNKIDLVICTVEICNQYGLPAARLNRIPIACHTRNLIPDFRSFWRTFLHFPDVLIANSKATAKSYNHLIRKKQRVEVIYNGVDLKEYSPSVNGSLARKKYGISNDKFLIGMIGRISYAKRQDVFVKALADVIKVYPDVCAVIVGDTKINKSESYLNKLKQMVRDLKLEDKIIFTGFVNNIKELYASLDLLVLPSQAEPFGRVLIEAMAMGKPVIATKSGGTIEVVDHGVTGILVKPDDIVSIVENIIRFVKDKNIAEEMGKSGRLRVKKMFSIEKNVKRTEEVYTRTVSQL